MFRLEGILGLISGASEVLSSKENFAQVHGGGGGVEYCTKPIIKCKIKGNCRTRQAIRCQGHVLTACSTGPPLTLDELSSLILAFSITSVEDEKLSLSFY